MDTETLKAVTPPAAERGRRTVDVKVVNPDRGQSVLQDGFTFIPLWPSIVSIELMGGGIGNTAGGEEVRIIGERFQEGIKIFFGEREAPEVTFVNAVELRAVTPSGPIGPVDVRAENPDGRSSVCFGCFTYVPGELKITGVRPNRGPLAGGNRVEILGENIITEGTPIAVVFGALLAETKEADPGRIVVIAPPAASEGPVMVIVTDGGGRTVMVPNAYTYTNEVNPGSDFVRGDVNGDGRLTVSDATFILQYLYGGRELTCPDAADLDDGGSVGLNDAMLLLRFLFTSGGVPPAPYPEAGQDPTPDSLGCER